MNEASVTVRTVEHWPEGDTVLLLGPYHGKTVKAPTSGLGGVCLFYRKPDLAQYRAEYDWVLFICGKSNKAQLDLYPRLVYKRELAEEMTLEQIEAIPPRWQETEAESSRAYQKAFETGHDAMEAARSTLDWLDRKDDAIKEAREAEMLLAQAVVLLQADADKYGPTCRALILSNLMERIKQNDTAREALEQASE